MLFPDREQHCFLYFPNQPGDLPMKKHFLVICLISVLAVLVNTPCRAVDEGLLALSDPSEGDVSYLLEPPAWLVKEAPYLQGGNIAPDSPWMVMVGDIDIPGLPILRDQKVPMIAYDPQKVPERWHGQTAIWYSDDCSAMFAYVAVRNDADKAVTHNEAYQVGFEKAIRSLGISLCQSADKSRSNILTFSYGGKSWTDIQLEEAASEIGTIRAAQKLGRPKLIQERFRDVSRTSIENYSLIRFLLKRSSNDPKRYESELGKAIRAFLEQHKK